MAAHLQDRTVTINGDPYSIRVSIKFFLALQELWDCSTDAEVRELIPIKSTQLRGMIDLIYAALRTHHGALTHGQVLDLMDGADLDAVAIELGNAMEAAAPPPADPQKGQGDPPSP